MTCKKFETWLPSRNADAAELPVHISDHVETCENCRRLLDADFYLEERLSSAFTQEPVPETLLNRIESSLDQAEDPSQPAAGFNYRLAAFFAGCAAVLVLWVLFTSSPLSYGNIQQFSQKAVQKHLKGDRSMSFPAVRIENAMETFRRELEFNVIIPDLKKDGYRLLGARLCAVGRCRAAYLFYEKGGKNCSLFIVDYDKFKFDMADGSRFTNTIKGCRTDIWKQHGQVYAMVESVL